MALCAELQQALGDFRQDVWIDSRELRGGDPLWPEIKKAIEEASAYAVLVSPEALQSKWVGKELRHALEVQKQPRQGQVPGHPAFAEWHQARRAGRVLRRGADLHPCEQRRRRDRGGDTSDPRRAGRAATGRRLAHAAAEGRAAGGTRARTHRLEVPRAGRCAPRLGSRPARL